jgi:hypothetical protein
MRLTINNETSREYFGMWCCCCCVAEEKEEACVEVVCGVFGAPKLNVISAVGLFRTLEF